MHWGTQACTLTRNGTRDPSVHRPELCSLMPHQPGLNIYIFYFRKREEGAGGERAREKHQFVVALIYEVFS